MRQPGQPAEGAGFHPRRGGSPAGGLQRSLQRGELAGQRGGETGVVEHQRTVGLEEDHEQIALLQPFQVRGRQRWLRGEPVLLPEHGCSEHCSDLFGQHRRDRQREPAFGRQARTQPTGAIQHQQRQGQGAEPTPASRLAQRAHDRAKRPVQASDQPYQYRRQRQYSEQQLPAGHAVHKQGRHLGKVLAVPVQVEGSAHQRRRGDIQVAPQHEHEIAADQHVSYLTARRAPPGGGENKHEQQHRQFDGNLGDPAHADRRPAILKSQRRVENEQRQQQLEKFR